MIKITKLKYKDSVNISDDESSQQVEVPISLIKEELKRIEDNSIFEDMWNCLNDNGLLG
jgi:translation elongation factor P/translation initiation factor 5A